MDQNRLSQFTLRIGEAACAVGLAKPEHIRAALLLQAKGLVLAQRHAGEPVGQWDPLYDTIETMYQAEQAPEAELQQALARLEAADPPKLPANAPYMKDCLNAVGADLYPYMNPMLAAQGAAKTVQLITSPATTTVAEVLNDTYALKDDSSEPAYVRASQSLHYLTGVMTAAINENPALADHPEIQTALMSAEMLAAQSMKRAAEALDHTPGRGPEVARTLREMRGEMRGEVNLLSRTLATSVHAEKLARGLKVAAAALPPEQRIQLENALGTHLGRIKELKVVGSVVDVMPDSWLSRIRPSGVSQGHGL